MKTILDDEKFDCFQAKMVEHIIDSIKRTLISKGIDEEDAYDMTGEIAFNVCAVIDGSAVMDYEGEDIIPFLGFSQTNPETKNEIATKETATKEEVILINSAGSYLHEMTFGVLDEVYDDEEE